MASRVRLAARTERSGADMHPQCADAVIRPESTWCVPPFETSSSIFLSRWNSPTEQRVVRFTSDHKNEFHVLTIPLKKTAGELVMGGRTVWSSAGSADQPYLTGPKRERWAAHFFSSFDHLRIWLPQDLIAEACEAQTGRRPSGCISLFQLSQVEDSGLLHLAQTFRAISEFDVAVGFSFVDSLGLALASRLVGLYFKGPRESTPGTALANQRLRRVVDYIEENLGVPLYLSELGRLAGLSRIHFSAQFKAATGSSPYAYIQQRRILRAKERLANPAVRIVDIALDLGFSSQAHFTEAFRRAVGLSPAKWRRSQDIATEHAELQPD